MLSKTFTTRSHKPKILIVEDEGLIASDIAIRLKRAGFAVAGIADSGEDTLQKVEDLKPDLILMDIRINGEMDGIDTAAKVQEKCDLPIIFLTAHSDRETVNRAKVIGAFGYLTKPLQHSNLKESLEIAIYKHSLERQVRWQRTWLMGVLRSMGEAVLITDVDQRIQFMNSSAERLTSWKMADAKNCRLSTVVEIREDTLKALDEAVLTARMLEDNRPVSLPRGIMGVDRNGNRCMVEGEIAPIVEGNEMLGTVIICHTSSICHRDEKAVQHLNKMDAVGSLASTLACEFTSILVTARSAAEQALQKQSIDPLDRSGFETVLQSLDAGNTLAEKLFMFGHIWTA